MTPTKEASTTDLEARVQERALQPQGTGKTLQDEIRDLTPQIQAGLPNGTLTPERFVRTMLTEVRKTPKLLNTTRESFLGAMMVTAQLGLEVGGTLGQAYLIPRRKGKGPNSYMETTLLIGYKGWIELAARSGILIEARDVRENDRFSFSYGAGESLDHGWTLGQDRGKVIGYYATATFKDGRTRFLIMDLADIEARKTRSQVKSNEGPWATDEVAMSKKTVIRALIPQLPLTAEMGEALGADEGVIKRRGTDLEVSFEDTEEVDAVDAERAEAEENLAAVLKSQGMIQGMDATSWLMTNYGPIPTLSDEALVKITEEVMGFTSQVVHEATGEIVDAEVVDDGDPGPTEPPVEAQAASRPSKAAAADPLAKSTLAVVNTWNKTKLRETFRFWAEEGTLTPEDEGTLRQAVFALLLEARKAGDPGVEDLF